MPAHVRMWNDLSSSVFDSGTLSGFKEQLILVCFISVCFLFFSGAGACGVALLFCKRSVFPTWAGVTYFNNNNNNTASILRCYCWHIVMQLLAY